MGWLDFEDEIGGTVKGIGEGISTTTQGIRHMFTGDIPPEIALELTKLELEANKLVTQQWVSDNTSGWAKYVRPFGFIATISSFLLLALLDGFTSISVPPETLESLENLLIIMVPAYYGMRTIEKIKGVTK